MTNWIYENKEVTSENIPEGAIGFIYMITNLSNDKKYIGKKLLTKAGKKKPLVLKDGTLSTKRKTSTRTESDWKKYWSSCDELKEDLKQIGKENFKREILYFTFCLYTHSYLEDNLLHKYNALTRPDFYNSNIAGRHFKGNLIGKIIY